MAKVYVKKQGWFNMFSLGQKARLKKDNLKKYRKGLKSIKKSHTGKWVDKKAYDKYRDYITKSEDWKHTRLMALDYYGNACCDCGTRFGLQVHHRHYRSLYNEKMTDLMVLCVDCHGKVHERSKYKKPSSHTVK